ncbi:5-formyltetrahydrofolate cyclo-ligase [Acidithiobacillus sp. AMEEHan]|uniref:5-formyltetrahydrofolate cyclo-ligase n=1 Tax=Acidithiobacillus sp. AMEEHan TaxID=2994951 RepID=UPI0027E58C2A|nr:5-formyltetrahydrofolate cyclo-ligase [Acidithiobacillus sp. AMEEHan]
MSVSKTDIRRSMRQRRAALSAADLRQAEGGLLHQLRKSLVLRKAHTIALYWPMRGEISALPILQLPWSHRQRFFLPVLAGLHATELRFAPFSAGTTLRKNRLAIPEPEVARRYWKSAAELDLLLLPLVAFDATGHRLGMGGGFYDRSLASLRHRRHWRRPRLVGVAHAFQELQELPTEPWDIPLDAIATEREYRSFRR